MSDTISPNMGLIIPGVGTEPGPQWATDLNASLTTLDSHNHASGSGVQVNPAGLDINSDLTFNTNNATALRSARFTAQGSPLSGGLDLGCVYVSGVDLYYNDENGNQIQITANGGIAGTNGSISNLTPPASASYVALSETFVWQSAVNTPANMDAASYVFRNLVANSKGLTLSPPAAMAANYSLVLPSTPASLSFMTLDASGNMGTSTGVPATQIAAGSITGSQIASATITGANVAAGTITGGSGGNIANTTIDAFNLVPNIDLPGSNPTIDGGVFPILTSDGSATVGSKTTYGVINTSGGIVTGEGFTCVRNSTGMYTITFTVAFSATPAILAQCISTSTTINPSVYETISQVHPGSFVMQTFNGSFVETDQVWTFFAIGPR